MAFPNKTKADILHIEKGFYLSFSDMIVETLVGRSFPPEVMHHFVEIDNLEATIATIKHYGGGFVMLGHFLNWEWLMDYANRFEALGVECGTVYKQLSSGYFDRLMLHIRASRGGFMVEMKQLLRTLVAQRNAQRTTCYAMLADQRPRRLSAQHRTTLLGQEVGMFMGTEQLARRFGYPVYYAYYRCQARGYYGLTPMLIYDPEKEQNLPLGTITERFARLLEENIRQEPSRWLWSHRRFVGSTPTTEV